MMKMVSRAKPLKKKNYTNEVFTWASWFNCKVLPQNSIKLKIK